MGDAATLLSPETWSRISTGDRMSVMAATLSSSEGVAVGRVGSGGIGVALPCASDKRSRVLL